MLCGCIIRLKHTEQVAFLSCDGNDYTGDHLPEVNLYKYEGETFEKICAYNLFIIEPDLRKDVEKRKALKVSLI